MKRYIEFGIDLGTTNSCIARWQDNQAQIFQNAAMMNATPSAVQITRTGRIVVGKKAYNAAVDDPDNVAMEFKRQMGHHYEKHFPSSNRTLSAVELSAEVLKAVLEDVHRQTGAAAKAAVITVPAAFGVLQCEATNQAARLAGLEKSPLLQEPIAAAIAYGVSPTVGDERFMVFDLGGGTLDIAIVSTRDRRLTVLEHRGNNHLGGKDIDRAIIERLFLPSLRQQYALPGPQTEPDEYQSLIRRLALRAEEAKIELSSVPEVMIDLSLNLEDKDGRPIEAELPFRRSDLEACVEPLLERCIQLAGEALSAARLRGTDLARILLVGGPTQMPYLRQVLPLRIGAAVDFSIDPMTSVTRGAAIYAATQEFDTSATMVATPSDAEVTLQLEYDAVSAREDAPVTGMLRGTMADRIKEVRLDATSGWWSSGWFTVSDGFFDTKVQLLQGRTNRFEVLARDVQGGLVCVAPNGFEITHQHIQFSAPPLPHSLCVEVIGASGHPELDCVFPKKTLLPAERVVQYRANRTLRPNDFGESLSIKVWEGEAFSDPEANTWVATMQLRAEWLRRPIPEGTPIELTIQIDESRLISVEAFVPLLNEHFRSDQYDIYMPDREVSDPLSEIDNLPEQIWAQLDRLDRLEEHLTGRDEPQLRAELEQLRLTIEALDIEANTTTPDADRANQLLDASKEIRRQVAGAEKRLGVTKAKPWKDEAANVARWTKETVLQYGAEREREIMSRLLNELSYALRDGHDRAGTKAVADLRDLRWHILSRQPDYWKGQFQRLVRSSHRFTNKTVGARWIAAGEQAIAGEDMKSLEKAVRQLWKLEPKDAVDKERETGLRR